MGAWGYEPFENDDALNFLHELDTAPETHRVDVIRKVLTAAATNRTLLASEDGAVAVAAAAVVARAVPGGADFQPGALPRAPIPPIPSELIALAVAALDRVISDHSELRELWADNDETGWVSLTTRLRDVLAAAA